MNRPKPEVVTASDNYGEPPSDAIILFDGKSLDSFETLGHKPAEWTVKGGYMEVRPGTGAIQTKAGFGDVQLHLEWASPNPAVGQGQDRGNSGIFFLGQFEVQVLDSYQTDTYADGQAGAIYGQYPPLSNAAKPPGQWQTYDIAFRRPRFDSHGNLLEAARLTVIHNGIVVQNNEVVYGPTSWLHYDPYTKLPEKGPIEFQDHGHKVRFRNIWVRELPERAEPTQEELKPIETVQVDKSWIDSLGGNYQLSNRKNAKPLTVKAFRDHLLIRFPNRLTELKLVPISKNVFQFTETDARFEFSEDGKTITFHIGGESRTIPKL